MNPPEPGPVSGLSVTAGGERGGHAGVDGVPSGLEHLRTGLHGERVPSGHGARS